MTDTPFIRIGIDIGGTFTDLQILNEKDGTLASLKTPTTPEDPAIGLVTGLRQAADRYGFELGDIRLLMHGTTIATNAVLERKLAKGVLLTTAGFEDVLEIGRHARRDIYNIRQRREAPLVRRDRRFGVPERMRGDGTVELALDPAALEPLAARIEAAGAEAVAVSLLNSYLNDSHERRVGDWLAGRFPDLPVSLSVDISPEIREFERTSTTVLNALLLPVVGGYLDRLAARLAEAGIAARVLLVQSNGGVCSPDVARRQPARLLLSGPSGGALATQSMAGALSRPNLLGVDMGGTSYDICVVSNGAITQMTQGEIDQLPVRLPMIEIRTIGSGGGSIAAIDDSGRLRVGPQSAGSRPGPVCYGRGGTEPTVTDANLFMGRLDARYFLGGAMKLDLDGCRAAVDMRVAQPLGLSADAAAEGMLTVVNASLAAAARLSLFEKGLDPRDFTLVSFGGAGGLHAIPVAEELGVNEVVFPADASTFSAYGILHSNIVHDVARSRILPLSAENLPVIGQMLDELLAQGAALLAADGVPPEARVLTVSADLRYRGQASELVVPWGDAAATEAALARLAADFHAGHEQRFSYSNPVAPLELVALRVTATGLLSGGTERAADVRPPAAVEASETRPMLAGGVWMDVPVYRRDRISGEIRGPALVEEEYTTILLSPGWSCVPGPMGTLIARKTGKGEAA
ncbi:hydantoinase/oxoprolinase family protein [Sinirhodobacter populi]|uniref:Hydantoinase/oxoprolinase family protein n=1 Tax=Paenirhodobacter populi TaxID=2306993 RepID=A0A443K530_9RHOB|nr:hydantoinase/oxoprolinase family protein [Sinirhodobacter populi]RWR27879.1 hydantoinase/oxoprolinase family protein [Sinirhodobacter populi]